jgi:hypothetical protein
MHTKITFNGETKEFNTKLEATRYIEAKIVKPIIIIECENEIRTFDISWQAVHFIEDKGHEITKAKKITAANNLYKEYIHPSIWQVRFILSHKFGLWVAKSKANKYNVRFKDHYNCWEPFVFAKKEQFGLTGEELKRFYQRYIKTIALV